MKIMLDTNVLISALFFPSQHMDLLFEKVFTEHTVVLPTYVIEELHKVTRRKFQTKMKHIDDFLSNISFELVYTPKYIDKMLVEIRDKNDYPILHTAIVECVDVLITGDKDFLDINIERPIIMTPHEFIANYEKIIELVTLIDALEDEQKSGEDEGWFLHEEVKEYFAQKFK